VTVPAKDWIVTSLVDRGPGSYYRYFIEGVNLNHPEGCADRKFSWSVPDIADDRYDFSAVNGKVSL